MFVLLRHVLLKTDHSLVLYATEDLDQDVTE